ncbi:MAG: ScpA family protein [Proteobacteria bacterium]|nr:ScpA family protein [Pseudomonadota bacterium]MDA0926931.1 ScpA family protein [Pseudomonadota bacterium]
MTSTGTEADTENLESAGAPASPEESTPDTPSQQELPLAIVGGEAFTEVPKDLYIPPDALEIFLEAFEGPLDLLLYLIKRQNIDILNINVADITDQYMAYVELMHSSQFELAAEYLVMAATLAEIKSRMILPRQEEEEADEDDPRMELIRRLQEYERYKQAAEDIDEMPRLYRDIQLVSADLPVMERVTPEPEVKLDEILLALSRVLTRADMFTHHHIQFETLSTREKMSEILARLSVQKFVPLVSLLIKEEGRLGVVVTFLAVMELMKDSMIEIVQSEPFGPIHVKSREQTATVRTLN